ncbi:MAG: hypothetical protein HY304_08020 [candidate division Zixibacteria bacterium]|nr:hypothetical protein [candidate division Zixibacteria bacterium]
MRVRRRVHPAPLLAALLAAVALTPWTAYAAAGAGCADLNHDGVANIQDVMVAVNTVFRGDTSLHCADLTAPAEALSNWFGPALSNVSDPLQQQALSSLASPVTFNAVVHDSGRAVPALLAFGDAVIQLEGTGLLDQYQAAGLLDVATSAWPMATGAEGISSDSLLLTLRCLHECKERFEHCRRDSVDSLPQCVSELVHCLVGCLRHDRSVPQDCIDICLHEYRDCLTSGKPAWWCTSRLAWCIVRCFRNG